MALTRQSIIIRRPGGVERLELLDQPVESPKGRELVIATHAVGVNFADMVVRLGLYPSAKEYVGFPITPGFEFSGEVVSVGPEANPGWLGKKVFGVTRFGGYSTHVTVPEHQVFDLPENLSLVEAAALCVSSLTAWYALIDLGNLRSGQSVLIHSAAGGVGTKMVQMAKLSGARVFGVVGSPEKRPLVLDMGADEVVEKGGRQWAALARRFSTEGFHLVLDANGYETLRASYQLVRPMGRLITYGAHSMLSRGKDRANWLKLAATFLRTPWFHPMEMTNKNRGVLAFNLSYLFAEADRLKEAMDEILGWVAAGQLPSPPIARYPLAQAAEAHLALSSGSTQGKIVLITQ